MTFAGIHSVALTIAAGASAAALGIVAGRRLIDSGMAQLKVNPPRSSRGFARVSCGLGGLAAVLAARHAGSWWLLPALLVWAFGLTAAAICDALTQRVPTRLVQSSVLLTCALMVAADAATSQWRWAAFALSCAIAACFIFTVCWRFLGLGFGDVRIAVLGALGLVDPTRLGLLSGVLAFVTITLGQAAITLARGGTRHTTFPYGLAIAMAFIVIATV